MKRGIQFLVLLAILFSFSNCEKKTRDILYDSRYKKEIIEARKEIAIYVSMNNIPGASFAVAKEGKIIYSEAMGVASKDLEVAASRKTKFRIGGISELFTSLIYQMMVENGTLNPDSAVQYYIPDYPLSYFKDYPNKITLNQLVSHTSGIRKPASNELDWTGSNVTLEKCVDNFKKYPLDFMPGYYQEQSENNYNLLGFIMEKVTGKSYYELLKTYITDSLQLTNTEIDNPFKTVTGRTDFFDFNVVAQVVNASFRDMRYRGPSDGLLSNAEDLVKFGNAILNSNLISNEIKQRLFVPTELLGEFPPTMANGWIVQKNKFDEFYYGKLGKVTGGGAIILIIPDKELVIAGTTNLTSSDEIPVFKIFAPFLTSEEKDQPVDTPN